MDKQKLIKEFLESPIKVDERVFVKRQYVSTYVDPDRADKEDVCIVVSVPDSEHVVVKNSPTGEHFYDKKEYTVDVANVIRITNNVGANPFPHNTWHRRYRSSNTSLESIYTRLFGVFFNRENVPVQDSNHGMYVSEGKIKGVPIGECDFNPYVVVNGEKKHYQRDYCWNLEDEQCFISSIYNRINCGTIVVRKRSYRVINKMADNGETDLFFTDCVDGKQRANTLYRFVNNMFPDEYGNYWKDLSKNAQDEFLDSQSLTYGELDEASTDSDVLNTFLSINFMGKPMSKEHIEYVKSINNQEK